MHILSSYCACSVSFDASQKHGLFSLNLLARSMIQRNKEGWKWQGSASVSPLMQEVPRYLFKLQVRLGCGGLCCHWDNLWFGAFCGTNASDTYTHNVLHIWTAVFFPFFSFECQWCCLSAVCSLSPVWIKHIYMIRWICKFSFLRKNYQYQNDPNLRKHVFSPTFLDFIFIHRFKAIKLHHIICLKSRP